VSSSWAALTINIVFSFFLAPFIVRSLGTLYYGVWTLLMEFTGYLWLFDFGVRESVVKYVAQHHETDEREQIVDVVHTAVMLYAGIGAIALLASAVMAVALPYVFNIPPEAIRTARMTLLIAGVTVAQGFVFNVYVGVLMGLKKFYIVTRFGIVFTVLRAALIFALLRAGYGIVALGLVHLSINVAMNLLVFRTALRHLPYLKPRLSSPGGTQVRRMLGYGKYVLINNIGQKLVFASDALVIGIFLPVSTLTYYAVAGSLVGYLKSFMATMASVLNPMSSALDARRDAAGLSRLFLTASKGAVIVGLPVCIGLITLGERFISIWMGPTFGPVSGPIVAVLAAAHAIGLPYYTITGVLYGLGKHRITATARVFEAAANITLSVILVKRYGLIGVAIGTLIPHAIVALFILPPTVRRLLSIPMKDYYVSTYGRPLIASLPFWGACVFIEHVLMPVRLLTFGGAVMAGLTVYAIPSWFLALSADERSWALQQARGGARK
jgi:O-antigen/teichoic acid export membrane protein